MGTLQEREKMLSSEGDGEQKGLMLCRFKDGKMHESVLSCSFMGDTRE